MVVKYFTSMFSSWNWCVKNSSGTYLESVKQKKGIFICLFLLASECICTNTIKRTKGQNTWQIFAVGVIRCRKEHASSSEKS